MHQAARRLPRQSPKHFVRRFRFGPLTLATLIMTASVSPILLLASPSIDYEWHGTGENFQTWHRNSAPIVVAVLPASRVPSDVPLVRLIFSGPSPDRLDWNVENTSRISVSNQVPSELPTASPPLAEGKYVIPGHISGPSSITVSIGQPYNRQIRIPTYTYASEFIGCDVDAHPGVRFDRAGVAHKADLRESDLYETGPPLSPQGDFFWGCPNDFATGTERVLHVPGGGRVLPLDVSKFAATRVSDWSADTKEVHDGIPSILIFRLRDGRIGKVLWARGDGARGAYIIAPFGGEFADVKGSGAHT